MKRTLLSLAAMLTLASTQFATPALGQDYAYAYPWWAGRYQPHHASTVYESARRGEADFIRAVGEYNLLTSQARIAYEEARRQYIENSVRGIEARYERRRLNAEYRASQQRPRATKEEMARFAAMNDPKRISAHELNPVSGEIHWPAALMGDEFAAQRAAMEAIFANRGPVDFGVASAVHADASELAEEMTDVLRSKIREMDNGEWIAAKNFIASLAHETRFAPVNAVAQNAQ